MNDLPLIVEPEQLASTLNDERLRIIDLSKAQTHQQYHVPGAVFLDYPRILHTEKPVMGLLPDTDHLAKVLGSVGIGPEQHVVAYDDEGGPKAARLLWTLEAIGHRRWSLLNGGLHAWVNEGYPVRQGTDQTESRTYPVQLHDHSVADREYILARLNDPSMRLIDARSPEEYSGTKKLAERGGHIPGAVNLNWLDTMDQQRNLRLRGQQELRQRLDDLGIHPKHEVIAYCHTHHRSAHSYVMLKWLGFDRLRGYPGAWSDWGNHPETPVERSMAAFNPAGV